MMARRYELSDQQFGLIEDVLSQPKTTRRGRPRRDDRTMLNGIFWVLCSRSARALWSLANRLRPLSTLDRRRHDRSDSGDLAAKAARGRDARSGNLVCRFDHGAGQPSRCRSEKKTVALMPSRMPLNRRSDAAEAVSPRRYTWSVTGKARPCRCT